MHFYFAYPATGTIRNSTGKLGAGLDVRGEGGYVLIPPSTHPSGASYEWASANLQLAPASAPVWLLEIVTSAARPVVQAAEVGIIPVGRRNDTLTRAGGYLRRKGLSRAEIENDLLERNARRCSPPLPEAEVRGIAVSVSRYPLGGPDPLEQAWHATEGQSYKSSYERFVALSCQLQLVRPGQPVALPLERIAALLRCDWTLVRRHRKRAVLAGLIHRVSDYIPHRRAAQYQVSVSLRAEDTCPTTVSVPLRSPTTGLVGHSTETPVVVHRRDARSGTLESSRDAGNGNTPAPAPRCHVHHEQAVWWQRSDGDWLCGLCHPNPAEARG
jgi:hypothetical protein